MPPEPVTTPLLAVAVYARISHDRDSDAAGVTRQVEDALTLVDRHPEWKLIGPPYVDNDISATRATPRDQYDRLMTAVGHGEVQVIVVYALSRLWRNRRQRADALEVLASHRVRVVTLKGPDLDLSTASGRMLAGLLGEVDTFEAEQIGERVARAKQQAAEQGRNPGGGRVYGLTPDRTATIPEEAAILQDVAKRVLAGEPLRTICRELNERGIRPALATRTERSGRTPLWNAQTLRRSLMNPTITGRRIHHGQDIGPAIWPAVLDRDTFDAVSGLLSGRTTPPGWTNKHVHLLSGIAKCGKCGATVVGTQPHRSAPRAYLCPPIMQGGCRGVRRAADPVDALVETIVIHLLAAPGTVEQLMAAGAPDAGEVLAVGRGIEAAQARAAAIGAAMADDDLTDEVTRIVRRTAVDKVRTELDTLRRRQAAMARVSLVDGLLDLNDVAAHWPGLTLSRRRAIVRALIDVVILPGARGGKFDPNLIRITRRTAS
ncbi:recombinase family protein [Frankia sp. Cas3]|uniref:recombinase family protein n=1 Tax=Frankia sp. Cas3 TaxID=3073926 RepID=UPI002AD44FD7|nr:recombinase family protein [Frankia sp. Cas3]